MGLKRFPPWDYLKDLAGVTASRRLVVVLKSRQMLVSWTMVAFLLWECILRGSSEALIISKREEEAKELLHRAKFIYSHLPESMQIPIGINTKNILEFPGINSRIISLPSSPDIGRTYSPNRILWDEMAFTPDDEAVFQSLQPSLDGGGKFIGVSTPNGKHTEHARLCLNAEELGFTRIDIHYTQHPYKDEKWKQEAQKGISQERWEQEQELSFSVVANRVYERFSERLHVIDWDFRSELQTYRTIDFGYHNPVILWIQVTSEDKIIICREWIGNNNTISELIKAIREGDRDQGIIEDEVIMTYCDPAGAATADDGISSVEVVQSRGIKLSYRRSNIMTGVNLVREKLMDAAGRISLRVHRGCRRVISDFQQYSLNPQTNEPRKDNITDHTMDALRYFIVNYFQEDSRDFKSVRKAKVQGIK